MFERSPTPGGSSAGIGLVSLDEGWRAAPVERRAVEERRWLLTPEGAVALRPGMRSRSSISRTDFGSWFVAEAVAAGAQVRLGTLVERLLIENAGVSGVVVNGEPVRAGVVVLCDGAGLRMPLRPAPRSDDVALAVSEIVSMPPAMIESRFELEAGDGVALRCFGETGFGLVVAGRSTLAVSAGVVLSDLVATGRKPSDLLARFKQHPAIRPLLEGSEVLSSSARVLPLAPRPGSAPPYGSGYLVCGDASFRAPAAYRSGCDFAITSGRLAGETVLSLSERGLPMVERHLREYAMRLDRLGEPLEHLDRALDGFLRPDGVPDAQRRAQVLASSRP